MQQEDDLAHHFSMSPDSKTMIVLLEREVFNDDVYTMVETPRAKSTTIEISEPNYSSNRIRSLVSAGNLPEEKETAG